MRKILITILLCFFAITSYADSSKNYYYYLGQWVLNTNSLTGEKYWSSPDNTIALVDLRTLEQQGQSEKPEGVGFFATTEELDASYIYLGYGYISNVYVDENIKIEWEKATGFKPTGDTLLDLLWDQLTTGSDPEGKTSVMPLMPSSKNELLLSLQGHSIVKIEKFDIKSHSHKEKVKSVLKNSYRKLKSECKNKVIKKDRELYLRVLDMWGEQYIVNDPENYFIPDDLKKEKAIPHETTYTESWDCSDSDSLNCGLTWDEFTNDIDIVSNKASAFSGNVFKNARADAALSSANHYAQADVEGSGTGTYPGVIVRKDNSSTFTCYMGRIQVQAGNGYALVKYVSGTETFIGASVSPQSANTTYTVKLTANGSTISLDRDGSPIDSATDTTITGNLYTGIGGFVATNRTQTFDDFEASDELGTTPTHHQIIWW